MNNFTLPKVIDMLKSRASASISIDDGTMKIKVLDVLNQFNIGVERIQTIIGPRVILFKVVISAGTRINKLRLIQDEIALALNSKTCRLNLMAGVIGIEIENPSPSIVSLIDCIKISDNNEFNLPVVLGKTINGETKTVLLNEMPHLLVAGATGQGKSVFINVLLTSLLLNMSPTDLKLILIDPKRVELGIYNDAKAYLLDDVIVESTKAINTLKSLCFEMDDRYNLLQDAAVRNISEYNTKVSELDVDRGHRHLPYIVVVIDEFADLMLTGGKDAEMSIVRLAQLARAVGIHLVVATQRPSTDIISGLIKANFPTRIAFKTTSNMDSRTILDSGGAEDLLGNGDMLYSKGTDLIRVQCPYISTEEVNNIVKHIKKQNHTDTTNFLLNIE